MIIEKVSLFKLSLCLFKHTHTHIHTNWYVCMYVWACMRTHGERKIKRKKYSVWLYPSYSNASQSAKGTASQGWSEITRKSCHQNFRLIIAVDRNVVNSVSTLLIIWRQTEAETDRHTDMDTQRKAEVKGRRLVVFMGCLGFWRSRIQYLFHLYNIDYFIQLMSRHLTLLIILMYMMRIEEYKPFPFIEYNISGFFFRSPLRDLPCMLHL